MFQIARWPQDISNPQRSLSLGRSLSGHNFQNLDFEAPKLSQSSSPLGSVGFCLRLGPRAAAAEAKHRCIGQPTRATCQLSSGFSRPRQQWMQETKMAVASNEDLGVENLLRHRIRSFMDKSSKTFAPTFRVFLFTNC